MFAITSTRELDNSNMVANMLRDYHTAEQETHGTCGKILNHATSLRDVCNTDIEDTAKKENLVYGEESENVNIDYQEICYSTLMLLCINLD